ncbi:hypothetical protein K8R62_03485, partial [bacterium]|nr:hypothetical protein [bacterium]
NILLKHNYETVYDKRDKQLNRLKKKYNKKINQATELIVKKEISSFLIKFKWVGYDYNGPVVAFDDVIKYIENPVEQNKEKEIINKQELIRKLRLKSEEKIVIDNLSLLTYTKDLRNSADDYIHYCFDNFYQELGKRFKLKIKFIKYLWPHEIKDLLINDKKYTSQYFQEKLEFCLADNRSGEKYLVGASGRKYKKEVIRPFNKEVVKGRVIKGAIASTGKVKGKVKMVYSYKDVGKVKEGDILVAYMTSPKFMFAILKSAAIITDDGGLTCHAAIISRELKKPCIIGTKIATQVLKDGDLVEVDADKGIVKIIK